MKSAGIPPAVTSVRRPGPRYPVDNGDCALAAEWLLSVAAISSTAGSVGSMQNTNVGPTVPRQREILDDSGTVQQRAPWASPTARRNTGFGVVAPGLACYHLNYVGIGPGWGQRPLTRMRLPRPSRKGHARYVVVVGVGDNPQRGASPPCWGAGPRAGSLPFQRPRPDPRPPGAGAACEPGEVAGESGGRLTGQGHRPGSGRALPECVGIWRRAPLNRLRRLGNRHRLPPGYLHQPIKEGQAPA